MVLAVTSGATGTFAASVAQWYAIQAAANVAVPHAAVAVYVGTNSGPTRPLFSEIQKGPGNRGPVSHPLLTGTGAVHIPPRGDGETAGRNGVSSTTPGLVARLEGIYPSSIFAGRDAKRRFAEEVAGYYRMPLPKVGWFRAARRRVMGDMDAAISLADWLHGGGARFDVGRGFVGRARSYGEAARFMEFLWSLHLRKPEARDVLGRVGEWVDDEAASTYLKNVAYGLAPPCESRLERYPWVYKVLMRRGLFTPEQALRFAKHTRRPGTDLVAVVGISPIIEGRRMTWDEVMDFARQHLDYSSLMAAFERAGSDVMWLTAEVDVLASGATYGLSVGPELVKGQVDRMIEVGKTPFSLRLQRSGEYIAVSLGSSKYEITPPSRDFIYAIILYGEAGLNRRIVPAFFEQEASDISAAQAGNFFAANFQQGPLLGYMQESGVDSMWVTGRMDRDGSIHDYWVKPFERRLQEIPVPGRHSDRYIESFLVSVPWRGHEGFFKVIVQRREGGRAVVAIPWGGEHAVDVRDLIVGNTDIVSDDGGIRQG